MQRFFVWHLLLYAVLRECVCAAYTSPTEWCVASASLTTVGVLVHALTAAAVQVVYDEPLQQLHSTCQLCIIHIYIALGNGDAAVSS